MRALQTRAWVTHSCYTVIMLWSWLFGSSNWQNNECIDLDKRLGCDTYNEDLMDPIIPVIRNMIAVLIVISAILDILCYKYRFIAGYLFYY